MKFIKCLVLTVTFMVFSLQCDTYANQIDFSGSWELDKDASDSMDAIFDLQKISWVKKKMGANLDAKPVIRQTSEGLIIAFDNVAGKTTQHLYFDGKEHLTQNPAGHDARFTSTWSKDGKALISTGPSITEDGLKGTLTEVRELSEDKTTMILTVSVKLANGKSASVRRVFRKKK